MTNLVPKILEAFGKQPYWTVALVIGAVLVVSPSISVDKDYYFTMHPPTTLWPVAIGIVLVILSATSFLLSSILPDAVIMSVGKGLDLTRVKEKNGAVYTIVRDCEIRVIFGRIEEYQTDDKLAIVLPCDEYFDICVDDLRTSAGVYANKTFQGQVGALDKLIKKECALNLGPSKTEQKTPTVRADSFGAGRCLLITKPLGRPLNLALISTATQRADGGVAGRISYIFDGMRELARRLAHERVQQIAMPVLGAGHAGMSPSLALVGLLLAVAELARYGERGESPRAVTVVVFKKDKDTRPQVDKVVVKRALALVS